MSLRVLKFGGTSVGNPATLGNALRLVATAREEGEVMVVVSALSGVTDQLEQALAWAIERKPIFRQWLTSLRLRHRELLATVAGRQAGGRLAAETVIDRELGRLYEILEGVALLREASPATRDRVLATGERLAVPVFVAGLAALGVAAEGVDAGELIRTDSRFGAARVDLVATFASVRQRLATLTESVVVVPGFLGADAAGATTILGRGGSDYTAALLGAALAAERVEIWTDVDGFLSADPRLLPAARPLPELTCGEAAELAFYGAKVLHRKVVEPLAALGIPLAVRNTRRPEAAGSWVRAATPAPAPGLARAIAALPAVSLLSVASESPLLAGLLASLEEQAALLWVGHSAALPATALAVPSAVADRVELELAAGASPPALLSRRDGLALVAAVGEGFRLEPHAVASFVAALESAGARAEALGDGPSERSFLAVVDAEHLARAVASLHSRLVLGRREVGLVLAGASGRIGRELVRQLAGRQSSLLAREGIEVKLVGALDSRRMAWENDGLLAAASADTAPGKAPDLASALAETLAEGEPTDWGRLWGHLRNGRPGETIFVDCTASDEVAGQYGAFLEEGIAVVTPNKRAGSARLDTYRRLQRLAGPDGRLFRHETTVGAALPVLRTLRQLERRGDRLRGLTAVLSGSLSFVLNQVSQCTSFSMAVAEARALGLTEPHPADDLSGEDVARKLLILLREAGIEREREEIAVESLIPPGLAIEKDPASFVAALAAADETWAARAAKAREAGERLVYLARYEGRKDGDEKAWVEVVAVPEGSPFARLRAGENLLELWSDHYSQVPLTIAGLGAGPQVTAAGVLSDILEVIHAVR